MKIEIYNPQAVLAEERWYWRIRAKNGKIIADGSEGYATKRNAMRAVDRLVNGLIDAAEDGSLLIDIHDK